jgi:hypothetical protein
VYSTDFVILINDRPSSFFKSSRGLRQGFPLSSLLFLLIVEGLSRVIHSQVREKNLEGFIVARGIKITHLMFVDDIILFGNGSLVEWKVYHRVHKLFFQATGMAFSSQKSMFLEVGWNVKEITC